MTAAIVLRGREVPVDEPRGATENWLPDRRRAVPDRPATPRAPQRPGGRAARIALPVRGGRPCRQPVAARYRRRRLLAAAVVTFVVVCALGLLGGWASSADSVPAATTTAEVGAGETVWHVARRAAPQSEPAAVVERIRQLNGMSGSAVRPGQPLLVPDGR